MPNYVRVVHRGRGYNVRVELPDGSTQLVNVNDLAQNWTRVERNADAQPFHRTRRSVTQSAPVTQDEPTSRLYIRVLHRGRGQHCRLLLPDGTTYLARTEDLPNWTCVGSDSDAITSPNTQRSTGFVNPDNQADRIYDHIVRRGSRNTSLLLLDGSTVHVPNEFLSTWIRRGSFAYEEWDERVNYPNGRELRHLTFGVELEFIANPHKYEDFCRAMRESLGDQRFVDLMVYGHSSTVKWVLGYDSSVRDTSARSSKRGYELTSPILKFNDESKEELQKVLQIISTVFEGTVNKTCGTHIHVGNFAHIENTGAFRQKAFQFQKNYGAFEARVFDRLVSPSRKGNSNHYCKSCNTSMISDRYYKINAQNLFGFGTLENRQHQGTLELKKIWSWMELNGRYMAMYFNNPSYFDDTLLSLEDFMTKIHLSEEAQQFFLAREAELN